MIPLKTSHCYNEYDTSNNSHCYNEYDTDNNQSLDASFIKQELSQIKRDCFQFIQL